MSDPSPLSEILADLGARHHRAPGSRQISTFVSADHYAFLRACCEPNGMDMQDLTETLLAGAIATEIEIHKALREDNARGEPSLTLDADTRLRMDPELPPWLGPLSAETAPPASPTACPTH